MNISKYWHTKLSMPLDIKEKLKTLASNGERISDNLLKISSVDFKHIFELNRTYLYRGDCTAPADEQVYENNRNYVTIDGLSGFSITPNGWIVSLFSNNKNNDILSVLNNFVDGNSKVVIISNDTWQKSHLILKYINKLNFRPIVVTTNSNKWMENKYGKSFVDSFTAKYGNHLVHIFLIKDTVGGTNTHIKEFESFDDAYEYVTNYKN